MAQIEVKIKLDLPVGVELLGYERCGDGHGFEVKFPLPDQCSCEKCGHEEPATYESKSTVYVVRDLDLWSQPSFLIFQEGFHRAPLALPFSAFSALRGRRLKRSLLAITLLAGVSGPVEAGFVAGSVGEEIDAQAMINDVPPITNVRVEL